jgi:hypothetical protein
MEDFSEPLIPLRADKVASAIEKAVDFLYHHQLSHGEFKTYISLDPKLENQYMLDSTPFVTTLVLYSINFVDCPEVSEMTQKAMVFLLEEMKPPGVWRYWTSRARRKIRPDLDDTSCASFALKKHHPHIDSNIGIILANRNEQGLFYTWINSRTVQNDVDSVVNANVLLYLGEREETKTICDYLNHIVLNDQEEGSYWYYLDHLALYYMMSRAYFNGVSSLRNARNALVNKITSQQQKGGLFGHELHTALAVCTLLNFEYDDSAVLDPAIDYILHRQQEDGAWSSAAFYTGPEPPSPHSYWFGSEELTTAFCIEALARYSTWIPSVTSIPRSSGY